MTPVPIVKPPIGGVFVVPPERPLSLPVPATVNHYGPGGSDGGGSGGGSGSASGSDHLSASSHDGADLLHHVSDLDQSHGGGGGDGSGYGDSSASAADAAGYMMFDADINLFDLMSPVSGEDLLQAPSRDVGDNNGYLSSGLDLLMQ